jgi:hypothetical protein
MVTCNLRERKDKIRIGDEKEQDSDDIGNTSEEYHVGEECKIFSKV